MSESIGLFSGSMNPFTWGHKHVVDTALLIFDRVVVALGKNPEKSDEPCLFTDDQREKMVLDCLHEHGDRISTSFYSGATVDYAASINAKAIIRGLRDETDQDYEASMSYANGLISKIEHGRLIPTIYIPCDPALTEISSSRVRELIKLHRKLEVLNSYVQPCVTELIADQIYKKRTSDEYDV